MIKVKIERAGDSVFYVEDGVTVQYADDVLEVLDEEDAVIAVFRGWVYALPITDEDYLTETGQAGELEDEEPEDDGEDEEFDFSALETSLNGHGDSRAADAELDDVTED